MASLMNSLLMFFFRTMMPVKSNSFCLLDDGNCSDEGDWGDACEEAMARGLLYASSCLLLLCVSESIACSYTHFFDFGGARGGGRRRTHHRPSGLINKRPKRCPKTSNYLHIIMGVKDSKSISNVR